MSPLKMVAPSANTRGRASAVLLACGLGIAALLYRWMIVAEDGAWKNFGSVSETTSARKGGSPSPKDDRVNIVLYLADDLGVGEVNQQNPEWGFGTPSWASELLHPDRIIHTPNLERLARMGVRSVNSYAPTSLCGPSRYAILVGRHVGLNPVAGNLGSGVGDFAMPSSERTVASLFASKGYDTVAIGKWGLGDALSTGAPWKQGFKSYTGCLTHAECHKYFPTIVDEYNETRGHWKTQYRQNEGSSNQRCMKKGSCAYASDIFREKAIGYLRKWAHRTTSRRSPFFMYWAPTTPHAGVWEQTERHRLLTSPVPSFGTMYTSKRSRDGWTDARKGHAAMITEHIDRDVGALLDVLLEENIANDTLVVFASDNGPHRELKADPRYAPSWFAASGGFRGIKRDMFEGGLRSPTITWWRGRIEGGRRLGLPWALYDLGLTFAEAAGIRVNPKQGLGVLKGSESILPHLLLDLESDRSNETSSSAPGVRDALYFELCPQNKANNCTWALLNLKNKGGADRLKFVHVNEGDGLAAYDILVDPTEAVNMASTLPTNIIRAAQSRRDTTSYRTRFAGGSG